MDKQIWMTGAQVAAFSHLRGVFADEGEVVLTQQGENVYVGSEMFSATLQRDGGYVVEEDREVNR